MTDLAVLDGRFLPVDEFTYSVKRDSQNVLRAGNVRPAGNFAVAQTVEGVLKTRRDPMAHRQPEQLRIYTDEREILLWQLVITGTSSVLVEKDDVSSYELNFAAEKWQERPR